MNALQAIFVCLTLLNIQRSIDANATFKINYKSNFNTAFRFRRGTQFAVEIYSENFKKASANSDTNAKPTISILSTLETSEKEILKKQSTYGQKSDWNITNLQINGPFLDFTVIIPLNTSVGLWNVTIGIYNSTSLLDGTQFRTFITFCAKCEDDYVYLRQQWERDLYLNQQYEVAFSPLVNQKFLIYKQSSQFVMESVNELMRNASISESDRTVPINVLLAMMRRIQYAYNKIDEKLNQNKGDLIDKVRKTVPNEDFIIKSSHFKLIAILKNIFDRVFGDRQTDDSKGTIANITLEDLEIDHFFLNVKNMKSVVRKAGEKEWFLSSVLVAISRTLGIPARLVTVINANAGIKNKVVVDYKQFRNLRQLEQSLYTDYDLWIEIWSKPSGSLSAESGWQVVDFGIDEKQHISIKGPASLKSIKDATISHNNRYFVSAIYGDQQQHLDNNFGISRDRYCNRVQMITSYNRLKHGNESPSVFADITGNYKKANGSCLQTNKSSLLISSNIYNNSLTLRIIENSTIIGKTFQYIFQIQNNCNCSHGELIVILTVRSASVKNDKDDVIDHLSFTADSFDIKVLNFKFMVKPENYLPKLNGVNALRIDAIVTKKNTGDLFALYYDSKLELPKVTAEKVNYSGEFTQLMVTFNNTINETLHNSELIFDGIDFYKVAFQLNVIEPLQHWKQSLASEWQLKEAQRAVIHKADICDVSKNATLLIVVKSDAINNRRRVYLRKTWIIDAKQRGYKVLFALGAVEDCELQYSIYKEDDIHNDIIQANFENGDMTLSTYFILKWVSTYCERIDYLLIVADNVVINVKQFTITFDEIYSSGDHHSRARLYGRLTEPALEYLDLNRDFEGIYYAKYMIPNAVIYTIEAVRFMGAAADNCCSPFVLSEEEIFFNGLLIEELNVDTVSMDNLDAMCDLPTVCNQSSIIMNCFRSESQCFTNWTFSV